MHQNYISRFVFDLRHSYVSGKKLFYACLQLSSKRN